MDTSIVVIVVLSVALTAALLFSYWRLILLDERAEVKNFAALPRRTERKYPAGQSASVRTSQLA